MKTWWDLGEWAGHRGSTLALYDIECAFCSSKGNFEEDCHRERNKPNSSKKLNFDTYKCVNCGNFVLVLWSASERSGAVGIHSYLTLPYPLGELEAPSHWPEKVQSYWLQAHKSLKSESWDAANMMARAALQVVMRDQNAEGRNLKEEVDFLATSGVLPPIMKDFSDEIRQMGNASAHPAPTDLQITEKDAEDIVKFLDILLNYIYDLPKEIADYRERKSKE